MRIRTERFAGADGDNATNRYYPHRTADFSNSVLDRLKSSGVPIAGGLTDDEFASIESSHGFKFPPDLHSILRQGLPLGPGFPNWRFKFPPNFHISITGGFLKLIPVYRHFYIAASPNLAGNTLFCVRGGEVRCCYFDLLDLFCREGIFERETKMEGWMKRLERRLRSGGWGESEVREMMMMEGSEFCEEEMSDRRTVVMDRVDLMWLVRLLSLALLRGGWSAEDVVYSMGGGGSAMEADPGGVDDGQTFVFEL